VPKFQQRVSLGKDTHMETCGWLIEVASGHPEPDSPSDMIRIVECGAPVTTITDGWECANGHRHLFYGSASQQAEEAMEERW